MLRSLSLFVVKDGQQAMLNKMLNILSIILDLATGIDLLNWKYLLIDVIPYQFVI